MLPLYTVSPPNKNTLNELNDAFKILQGFGIVTDSCNVDALGVDTYWQFYDYSRQNVYCYSWECVNEHEIESNKYFIRRYNEIISRANEYGPNYICPFFNFAVPSSFDLHECLKALYHYHEISGTFHPYSELPWAEPWWTFIANNRVYTYTFGTKYEKNRSEFIEKVTSILNPIVEFDKPQTQITNILLPSNPTKEELATAMERVAHFVSYQYTLTTSNSDDIVYRYFTNGEEFSYYYSENTIGKSISNLNKRFIERTNKFFESNIIEFIPVHKFYLADDASYTSVKLAVLELERRFHLQNKYEVSHIPIKRTQIVELKCIIAQTVFIWCYDTTTAFPKVEYIEGNKLFINKVNEILSMELPKEGPIRDKPWLEQNIPDSTTKILDACDPTKEPNIIVAPLPIDTFTHLPSKWPKRFLELCDHLSTWSKDPSTGVAAIIVDKDKNVRAIGYNGLPRGVEDTDSRLTDRDQKYPMTVHAELNAITSCARLGVRTDECTIVCTHFPCSPCAGSIINAGIKEVIVRKTSEEFSGRWAIAQLFARTMFKEAGVCVTELD